VNLNIELENIIKIKIHVNGKEIKHVKKFLMKNVSWKKQLMDVLVENVANI